MKHLHFLSLFPKEIVTPPCPILVSQRAKVKQQQKINKTLQTVSQTHRLFGTISKHCLATITCLPTHFKKYVPARL